jgi:hypothetical protein
MVILVILVILVMACILYSPKAEGYVHSQRSRPERNGPNPEASLE